VYIALMNHLQVAAGTGEGMNYDLDIATFTNAFKLNILSTTYAVKALEQDDIISFNEIVFKPSSVLVIANRNDITEFEKIHPELEPMIKGLLRSYEGIFDFPSTVYESQLAKFLRKDIDTVKKELQQLNDYSMIVYTPQKDKPQVTLLKNRMYADSYTIKIADHLKRKKNFETRIVAILDYVNNTGTCRSKMIAAYFNAPAAKVCGICDNCINEKAITISKEEFEHITSGILQLVNQSPLSVKQIQQQLKTIKKEKLWKVINYLQSENKLAVNKDGNLSAKNLS